jgi:hypothetical protein
LDAFGVFEACGEFADGFLVKGGLFGGEVAVCVDFGFFGEVGDYVFVSFKAA